MRIRDSVEHNWSRIKNIHSYIPEPNVPENLVDIPSNPDDLIDVELDRCLLSFGSWRSYIISKLAMVESHLNLLEEAFQIQLGAQIAAYEESAPKKMLKESLHGKAVTENKELLELHSEISILRSEKILLSKQFDFFNGNFETISRIVTRRGNDRVRGI